MNGARREMSSPYFAPAQIGHNSNIRIILCFVSWYTRFPIRKTLVGWRHVDKTSRSTFCLLMFSNDFENIVKQAQTCEIRKKLPTTNVLLCWRNYENTLVARGNEAEKMFGPMFFLVSPTLERLPYEGLRAFGFPVHSIKVEQIMNCYYLWDVITSTRS